LDGSRVPKYFDQVVGGIESRLAVALDEVASEVGPPITWERSLAVQNQDWRLQIMQIDQACGEHNDPVDARVEPRLEWDETGFARAARAYRREARWDFAPDEAGVWIIAVAPSEQVHTAWRGNLVAFIILHDRDHDGEYESIAHLWTATGWRRRGIAAALIERARERFRIHDVEGPMTESGEALLSAAAPDLLAGPNEGR
jgi:ribosomal protein S18 acetylase RimI-like enzyme